MADIGPTNQPIRLPPLTAFDIETKRALSHALQFGIVARFQYFICPEPNYQGTLLLQIRQTRGNLQSAKAARRCTKPRSGGKLERVNLGGVELLVGGILVKQPYEMSGQGLDKKAHGAALVSNLLGAISSRLTDSMRAPRASTREESLSSSAARSSRRCFIAPWLPVVAGPGAGG